MYTRKSLEQFPYFSEILKHKDMSVVVDSLTGLVSRSYIIGYIHYLIDQNIPFTLALLDLDNFKYINDTQGHKIGDGVLAAFGSDITRYLEDYGVAGRYGGDEFLIINLRDTDYNSVKQFYVKMYANFNVLRKNIKLGDCEPFITGTIGSATFPTDASDYDSLFGLIDKTLYRGKTKGRNCYIIYVEEKHKDIQIKQITRRGLNVIFNDITMKFDTSHGLHGKLESILNIMCNDLRIENLYYLGKDSLVRKIGSDDTFGIISDLEKIVVNNTYATNEVDEFIDKAPSLYNYCLRKNVSSILIVRVGLHDRTYGYLMCAEPYTRRIWQDDEEAMMYFLARTIAGYIMLSGEEL